MRASFALAFLAFIAAPILARPFLDNPASALIARQIANEVIAELQQRDFNAGQFLERRFVSFVHPAFSHN
jgi:hypothetical protein